MSTIEPGAKYEPLAQEGERVEATPPELGVTIEDRVVDVNTEAEFGTGPRYVYVLERGLRVGDDALR